MAEALAPILNLTEPALVRESVLARMTPVAPLSSLSSGRPL